MAQEKVDKGAGQGATAPGNGASAEAGAFSAQGIGVAPVGAAGRQGEQAIRMDTTAVKSSYCNMVNVTTTREEVVMNFGINESWDRAASEYDVRLEHRVVMSPFAAKRLALMLGKLVEEYEGRYGELK